MPRSKSQTGQRKDQDKQNRKDSFIITRF